jgi:Chaperone of endosialidase
MKNARILPLVTCLAALLACGRVHGQSSGTGFNAPVETSTAAENTATGKSALSANTTGNYNTATGGYALEKNTTGSQGTATGYYALENNTSGAENTADGYAAMNFNTTGYSNTAGGSYALNANTTGYSNTANGSYALTANTTGCSNTASGRSSLFTNATGSNNTATGFYALYTSTGSRNTADGMRSLNYLTTGEENVALGYEAGYDVTTGSGNIEIGSKGDKQDDATIRLGTQGTQKQTFVAGIFGATATAGVPVVVTSNGQLGTVTSSAKYKQNIRDMGEASDALLALRPVTFQYKPSIDPAGAPQFGLVAEEVEKVSPDLVVRDAQHQIYSVRYDAVNAMLLNEFQKEHKVLADQEKTIAEQQKLLEGLAARIAQLEKR